MLFDSALKPKLIYVFRINDESHRGTLKIGETILPDGTDVIQNPNSHKLNEAARNRINQYTKTAGIDYELLHTEMTLFLKDGTIKSFNDKAVHDVLLRSGIKRRKSQNWGSEWFETDLETVKKAIGAVKEGRQSLLAHEVTQDRSPIAFRPEQQEAINKTIKQFKKGNAMLWNAKMRFGKTLSALQVVKKMNFKRTLILTHRPVVDDGWYDDFGKIFYDTKNFAYASKNNGADFKNLEKDAKEKDLHYIYFASMQDLRGSETVGGKFDKNDEIFSTDWNLIIVDEAHEGTQTELGTNVMKELTKPNTKVLSLSGTPFNLIDGYKEDQIYEWTYIDEQKAKMEWDKSHFGDPNPYAGLPEMNIYTYNLGDLLKDYIDEDIAFNFREFFRVNNEGKFVHHSDVKAFVDLLCKKDELSAYPFSNDEYRDIFRHTLWMVPGVKSALALQHMLEEHPVFQHFSIVNVAGEGDPNDESKNLEALELLRKQIGSDPDKSRTITLSCGRLTTGVNVPEWTAVMMISGSFNTAAAGYMQTIFRVQTPATINGRVKEKCYVFDFAPDRTLKVLAETAKISTKAGKTSGNDRKTIGEFLNFCPVIGMTGSQMKNYDVDSMLQQLKKVYIERVVRNGFEDNYLYNDKLLKMDNLELEEFNNLKKIIGATKAMPKSGDIEINNQGLNDEKHEESNGEPNPKPKPAKTEEEKEREAEQKQRRKNRDTAISILRGISIRLPLMIYGANIDDEKQTVTIDNFPSLVDDLSWEEFMPKGVSKETFNQFNKYYDRDIFAASAKRIRSVARAADKLSIEQRIERISQLFSSFRNPDKETVLTPWRVVNMHISDTIGGYSFFDKEFKEIIPDPRFVDRGEVTETVFNPDSRILEINSKTGLYPLYMAYSVYRARVKDEIRSPETIEEEWAIWEKTVRENIFVVCKTPMAKNITKRTLVGFRDIKVNTRYFEDLINQIKNKPANFIEKVAKGRSYWKAIDDDNMKFNAVVGNPPYQEIVAQKETNNGQKRSSSIFHYFQIISEKVGRYTSLIYPGARWIHRSGKGLEQFGYNQINDQHLLLLKYFPDSTDVFADVGIADGLSIVLKDGLKKERGFKYIYSKKGHNIDTFAENPGDELFALNPLDKTIVTQLTIFIEKYKSLHNSVLSQKLFSIESDFVEKNPKLVREYKEGDDFDKETEIKLFTNDKAGKSGRARWYIAKKDVLKTGIDQLNKWKVIVSSANAGGQKRSNQIAVVDNYSAFGRSRVALKTFDTEAEARNFFKYATSEVIRFAFLLTDESLTSLAKKVPDLMDYSKENPLIDYSKNINEQLYELFGIDENNQKHIKDVLATKKQ